MRNSPLRSEQPNMPKTNDSSTKPSSTGGISAATLSFSVIKKLSTRYHLPPGWENFGFRIRGNGIARECPVCRMQGMEWRCGEDVPQHQLRTVIMAHMMTDHFGPATRKPHAPAKLRRIK